MHVLYMTFLVVGICTDLTEEQSNETNKESDALLSKLLYLHQDLCGETATCGSSEHVEPSEFVIQVPCCLPCSCLPSCLEQHNCCPWSVNGTRRVPLELHGQNNIVPEIGTNITNDRLIPQGNDDITLTTNDNKTVIHDLDRASSENPTSGFAADYVALNPNAVKIPTTKCIRPQAIDNRNIYLDSPAYMSRIVRKPDFCLGENKGADQLRGNREADQRLRFRYTDSTIFLLTSEISSF